MLVLVIAGTSAEDSREDRGHSLDWPGQISLACGLTGLVQGMGSSWGTAPVLVSLGIGVVGLVVFVLVERSAETPLLDFALFRIPAFSTAVVAALIGALAFLGVCTR